MIAIAEVPVGKKYLPIGNERVSALVSVGTLQAKEQKLKMLRIKRAVYNLGFTAFILVLLFLLIMVVSLLGCKKYTSENPGTSVPKEKKWIVTTVAGEGSPSFADGALLSAKFHFPEDVAVAPDGTVYVTDVLNFSIRKIAGGQVSTFAGGGGFGIVNGTGTAAQFKNPYSITVDANGNLYTTDENDPRIRKISAAGEVTTYAGVEFPGFADGRAETARFGFGNSIISDATGNVYMADAENSRIRKISVSGEVTTIAGSGVFGFNEGNGTSAQFAAPGGITIDKQNNLYVVDRANFRIRKITAAGTVSTIAGNGTEGYKDGNAGEAQFGVNMHDIVIDDQGNLYLQDNQRIRKITAQGIVTTIAGSTQGYADGEGVAAKFNFLAGMGIDTKGNPYVADLLNNRIRKISFE